MSLSTVGKQVKYGLISKKPAAPPQPKPRAAAFSMDDSDDDDGGKAVNEIARVNAQLAKRRAADEAALAAASIDDPSIYDYDGEYDKFKSSEVKSHHLSQPSTSKEPPKSRYVSNLLSTAKMREKEKERIFEKKLLKERAEEDKEFGDKPKFVTAAYKNKMIEDQKWEYENRLAEELEQRTDVRKSGMHGFYANLLTKNVAMGGDVQHSVSVYTAGGMRQNRMLDDEAAVKAGSTSAKSGDARSERQQHEDSGGDNDRDYSDTDVAGPSSVYRDASSAQRSAGQKRSAEDKDSTHSRRDDNISDRYADNGDHYRNGDAKNRRLEGDGTQRPRAGSQDSQPRREASTAPTSDIAADSVPVSAPATATMTAEAATKPVAAVDKTVAILSAKDRYLARKRAQEQGLA